MAMMEKTSSVLVNNFIICVTLEVLTNVSQGEHKKPKLCWRSEPFQNKSKKGFCVHGINNSSFFVFVFKCVYLCLAATHRLMYLLELFP